eukprot:TRINITY_DN150_c0_g2_i1.p2 TRINITY_DN150_c0_g2~~TRINITY_DN150_c0_g2_i1.p2  ORF type:complete len:277 (+),score=101.39 TRINITY_DN150_c0_g2_i1:71-901(+)
MDTFRIVLLVGCIALSNAISIGDRLLNGYNEYSPMPTDAASATKAGWSAYNKTCDPILGIPWAAQAGGPVAKHPVTLYFTTGGQIAGVGVTAYGKLPQHLVDLGFWQKTGSEVYTISVTFRTSGLCDGSTSPDVLGESMTVNANSIAFPLPTTSDAATASKWIRGSCIATMGTHYFYDVSTPGNMSYVAANLMPVVTMYNGTNINAIFFASPIVQQGLLSRNNWDGVPLPDIAMCYNWCDSKCTWSDTSFWSTMHFFMNDYTTVPCAGGCKVHCCP